MSKRGRVLRRELAPSTATATELAWAAGLYEGEGSAGIGKQGRFMKLNMTDEEVVREFARIIGVGHVGGPYKPTVSPKPVWVWYAGSLPDIMLAGGLLGTMLSERRRAQIDKAVLGRFQ